MDAGREREAAAATEPPPLQEAQSKTADHRFRDVAENATDGIVLLGRGRSDPFFNRAGEWMFGWRREDVLGKIFTILLPEKVRPIYEKDFARILQGGLPRVPGQVILLDARRRR